MQEIRRILVALDLELHGRAPSRGSRLAADQALRLAPALHSEVVLMHSTASDERFDPAEADYVVVPEGISRERQDALDEVAEEFRRAGISTELTTSAETAWIAIVRRVLRDGIDLVLSGKRNEAELAEHRIGSVSMKLLRKCPCAVWVVKPGRNAPPRRILAATDLTAVGERVVRYAALVAEREGAQLHVVHALQLPLDVQLEGEQGVQAFEKRERQRAMETVKRQLSEAGFTGAASFHVGLTAPTRAVTRVVEQIDPDLVVMGTVSRGGIAGLLVGNTAERLLGRLDCSLLTVKPADFVCPVPRE